MGADSAVGAHRDLDASLNGPADRVGVRLDDHMDFFEHTFTESRPGRGCFDHESWGDQSRHKKCVVIKHHLDRFVVEIYAVLDRADAIADRCFDAVRGLGMCHDMEPGCGGLLDEHLEFFVSEMAPARVADW